MVGTLTLYQTAIGKKAVMAVTGLIGYGFVLVHMLGNLKMFAGPVAMNEYAHHIRVMGEPIFGYGQVLYIIRTVLFIALVAHVVSAVLLTKQDVDGRPTRYVAGRKNVQASFASLTLRWGGLALFFFIIFHLMQLTLGTITPDFRPDDAYHNVIVAFSSLPVVVVYLAAMFCLAAHLFHGVWSAFQTLGLNDRRTDRLFRVLAVASAVLLFVGFSSVPVAVLLGWVS